MIDFDNIDEEEYGNDDKIFLNVKLLEFDKVNRNGRIYKKEHFIDEIKEQYYGEYIKDGDYSRDNYNDILLNNVTHSINNIEMKDDGIYGDIEILNTESANILLDSGIEQIGIASRGYGSVNENNEVINYKLLTFDFVDEPSSDTYIKLK
jgi:hypothetical protein